MVNDSRNRHINFKDDAPPGERRGHRKRTMNDMMLDALELPSLAQKDANRDARLHSVPISP